MSRLSAIAAVLVLAGGLTGCGIPDETGVHVEGSGPARGDGSDIGPRAEAPGRLDSGDDVKEFAANFLRAAAGEISGAYERVTAYIAPASRGELPEPQENETGVNIVRLTEPISINHRQDGTSSVTIKVQHVGVLRSNGAVDRPELTDTSYTFTVGKLSASPADEFRDDVVGTVDVETSAAGAGLYVLQPPPALLMSEEALRDYYETRIIYFWSKDRRVLVPDLRHLPLAVPQSRRADEVVGWLVRGPATWLADVVAALPAGTQKSGNVTYTDGRLVVNLSIEPSADHAMVLNQLTTQLAWSLRLDHAGLLEVKIKDESRETVDVARRRLDDPVYRVNEQGPQRYAVYGGSIRALKNPGGVAPEVPVAASVNRNVVSAAMIRLNDRLTAAALVVDAGAGQRLSVGSGLGRVESVASSATYTQISRPVWLKSTVPAKPRGLVVADGKLYEFSLYGVAALKPVFLPGAPGQVTAVAASLDGYRIAYIADGALYVAGLTISDEAVRVLSPRLLRTQLSDLSAVEWIGENRLVVAGVAADNQVALHDIGDDGALDRSRVSQRGTAQITHLATYPENPVRGGPERVMYEVNGVAWDVLTGERIGVQDVEGVSKPSPGRDADTPTAPFFVY